MSSASAQQPGSISGSPDYSQPRISTTAVVVAHNGGDALLRCIESLLAQSPSDLGIIVVDNLSSDGSIDRLQARMGAEVKVIRRASNGGYAAGANEGWRLANSEVIVILNQDVTLHPKCVAEMRRVLLASNDEAIVTPKIVMADRPDRVNAVGNDVHLTGVAWCNGLGTAAAGWTGTREVTAISGAAFMLRRSLLERLNGLDERYFMYMEDVDLSLRAHIAGATCLAACDAVATHEWRLTLSPERFEILERNRRAMWFSLWGRSPRMAPFLLQAELLGWGYAVLKGPRYVMAKVRGYRGGMPKRRWPQDSMSLVPLLAREHPYDLLFPGARSVGVIGRMADRVFTIGIRGRRRQATPAP